jgi:hypothetical protein
MVEPGDIVRLMYPIGTEEDPSSNSVVIGDVGLVLLIKQIRDCSLHWEPPPKLYSFDGDIFVKGKIKSGIVYAIKISEQIEKYF